MTPACTRVMEAYEGGQITRRDLLRWLPVLVLAPKVMAQASDPAIRVRALNHMTLTVSDPKRSLEFYQGLFGMPKRARARRPCFG